LISVNLGESPSQRTDFWFVPDVVVAVVVLGFWLVLRIGIDWADDVRKKREAVHLEDVKKVLSQLETTLQNQIQTVGGFDALQHQIEALKQGMTPSEIRRKPITLLQMVQKARQPSLWFSEVEFFDALKNEPASDETKSESIRLQQNEIRIVGFAKNHEDLGAFIAAMQGLQDDTKRFEFFDVRLEGVSREDLAQAPTSADVPKNDVIVLKQGSSVIYEKFVLRLKYRERSA